MAYTEELEETIFVLRKDIATLKEVVRDTTERAAQAEAGQDAYKTMLAQAEDDIRNSRARAASLDRALRVADAELAENGYTLTTNGVRGGRPREVILCALSAAPSQAAANGRATELHKAILRVFPVGSRISVADLVSATNAPDAKKVANVLDYLTRKGRARRIDRGIYERLDRAAEREG